MVALEESREPDRIQEQQKAELVARLVKELYTRGDRSFPQYYLCIENLGLCEARDIVVLMVGMPVLDQPAIPKNQT